MSVGTAPDAMKSIHQGNKTQTEIMVRGGPGSSMPLLCTLKTGHDARMFGILPCGGQKQEVEWDWHSNSLISYKGVMGARSNP